MHDPLTVAFEIRYPWRKYGRKGRTDFERTYRASFITIWHRDPEHKSHEKGLRGDDSCGWFTPPTTPAERERIRKIGREEWRDIFGKRAAVAEKKDYAYICFEPTHYDAVYWAWRRIAHERSRRVWKYGVRLTRGELQAIYELAANPVDNLRSTVDGVNDAETCADFFLLVYRAYLRHRRPWWRHPRWHFWHWRLQIHSLQKLRRRLFDRCFHCGRPFGWNESPVGNWDGDKVWHSACDALNRPLVANAAADAFQRQPVPPVNQHGQTLQ